VPWCDDCAKFWSLPSLRDGTCPTCGSPLEGAPDSSSGPAGAGGQPAVEEQTKAPWHFKLLLVALVVYLSYRAYQGVWWVGHTWLHLF
jgi:hypothetical protein